ncbi:MAG: SLC13 family permease [Gammaproteobacteria bacterium]|nr:SLC13 family permease [Gammaproteobacteria bacterium]MCY4341441.1 SLC13 family permease [Gammaproteobacteria bacterium]
MLKSVMRVAGPLAALAAGLLMRDAGPGVAWTVAATTLCALWWITEAVPIPVTALVPIALLPLAGAIPPEQAARAVGDPLILLLMGGFMLSTAMEKSGVHRRIALGMINLFGSGNGRRLVFGFMAAAALLSMWISNTATTLMLLPIAVAVIQGCDDKRLALPLLLGMCYAASIGGTGTPVGTPPNLIFMRVYQDSAGAEVGFTQWMQWALPIVLVMLPVAGLWLTRGLKLRSPVSLPATGAWSKAEVRTLVVFAITALLWVTRREPFGGWSGALGLTQANDGSVALLAVVAMFLVPNGSGARLLDWKTAVGIPWGILLLFAGGICLAGAFSSTGLSATIGEALASYAGWPPWLLILLICLAVTFLTEITSNTATTSLLMPILAAAAIAAGIEPRTIMVPAAISASFAFMLPVATGPNAVVFSSGRLTVPQMAREGLVLNLLGALIISTISYFLLS